METVRTLIVGAGITGLATAAALSARGDDDYVVLEASAEIGGWCKTVKKEGFVWDYSGHFFHFKHPEIEAWLRQRMPGQRIRVVEKKSFIAYKGRRVDFPFQKNIHQLPQDEFIDCLHDLYLARSSDVKRSEPPPEENFKQMLYARFGESICEKFLVPYNEKLYACDLTTLDRDAMGRFFPYADLTDVVRNMKRPDNTSYNATFTYPEGGAIEYVKALAGELRPGGVALEEALVSVDLDRGVARTTRRSLAFRRLVSSAPFDRFSSICGLDHDRNTWVYSKVLIFNLGFDRKGDRGVHWVYFPARETTFYRVGWYDNIFDTDRMSLYVEIGFPKNARIDVAAERERVLADLAREGIVTSQRLVAEHWVVLDPAYVHVTQRSLAEHKRLTRRLAECGVWSLGRYGGWTYCAIEDNIVEARALVDHLGVDEGSPVSPGPG
ncbi:MAG TPA: FAD-dependent oxidoreductase [Polyangiaceae bacterium]|nr:FAD-dependent oxidoreductase [Polyangiaceae bacterium]